MATVRAKYELISIIIKYLNVLAQTLNMNALFAQLHAHCSTSKKGLVIYK